MLRAVSEAAAARPRLRNALIALALAASLCTGAVVWWRDGGKRLFQPRKWDAVDAGFLYRSGQIHRRLIEDTLRDHGIDLVIDLAKDESGDPDAAAERAAIERLGIRRIGFDLDGAGRGDPSAYSEALAAIAQAKRDGEQVLVHCNAGSERTGGVAMLYRTLFQGWSGADAYAEYARYRNRPPESGRVAGYLNANVGRIARELVAAGALESVPDPLPVYAPPVAAR
jgi:protein tyrosine phosphatase (PTP) superfamily phosphohydrolase (DUF442 family)